MKYLMWLIIALLFTVYACGISISDYITLSQYPYFSNSQKVTVTTYRNAGKDCTRTNYEPAGKIIIPVAFCIRAEQIGSGHWNVTTNDRCNNFVTDSEGVKAIFGITVAAKVEQE